MARLPVLVLPLLLTGCGGCGEPAPNPAETGPSGDTSGDSSPPDDTGTSIEDLDPWVEPEAWVTPADLEPGGQATIHYRGFLADRDRLEVRYGFNGWNEVADGGTLTRSNEMGDDLWWGGVEMTRLDGGGFEATVDLPEDARALHFRFVTDDVRPGDPSAGDTASLETWDDREGRDWGAGIRFPYIGPFLTWNDAVQPEDGVVVNWETGTPCLGVVSWGTSVDALDRRTVGTASDTVHHVALTGLHPDTTYWYRVHDNRGQASEAFSFRTAPTGATSVRFVVFSDAQDKGERERWPETAAEILSSHADVDLLLVAGDLAADDTPWHWWSFFDPARDLLAGHPILPVPGNHDTPTGGHHDDLTSFTRYFDLPRAAGTGTGATWRVDRGDIRFLGINSERASELDPGGVQYEWMAAELADAADFARVFAAWHVPAYDAAVRHTWEQWDTRPLTDLTDGAVDWVFAGHEHVLQRMKPLRRGATIVDRYGRGEGEGTGFLVLPPSGYAPDGAFVPHDAENADLRDLLAFPVLGETQDSVAGELGFVRVEADAARVTLTVYGMGTLDAPIAAHVVDTITVETSR